MKFVWNNRQLSMNMQHKPPTPTTTPIPSPNISRTNSPTNSPTTVNHHLHVNISMYM